MGYEFFISGRYLRPKRKQTFLSFISTLSALGVMVGIMVLVVVMAVMTGAKTHIQSTLLGVMPHVLVLRYGGPFADYEKIMDDIGQMEGCGNGFTFIYTQALLRSASGISGAVLRGINPASAGQAVENFQSVTLASEDADESDPNATDPATTGRPVMPGIVLGRTLAENLKVKKGDTVYVFTSRGKDSGFMHAPAMRPFIVNDTYASGMHEYDSSLCFIHIQEAQDLLNAGDSVTGIEVRIKDIYAADQIAMRITGKLGFPFRARDWMGMNQHLFSFLELQKTVMFIILALIVLVAAFNIASTLIMMVMEKKKDIAILKAMGATDAGIRRIFILKGMTIGIIGTTLGLIFGTGICMILKRYKIIELPGDVYYFSHLPVQMQFSDMMIIAAATLLICFLSTLYPA